MTRVHGRRRHSGSRAQGVRPQTAYRWFRVGRLPVPAVRVNARTVLVAPDAAAAPQVDGVGVYARVSSPDRRADLDRQVARLSGVARAGWPAGVAGGGRGGFRG